MEINMHEPEYVLGVKNIARFFGLPFRVITYMLKIQAMPFCKKIDRPVTANFTGGGVGVWAIEMETAKALRHTRRKTPEYDPRRAVEALVNKFEGSGCSTIPELIEGGYIDDNDWCAELNRQRELSNLHVPILMHPNDLVRWLHDQKGFTGASLVEAYPETAEIFKQVRETNKNGTR